MIHTMSMEINCRKIGMSMDLDSNHLCDAGIIDCCHAGKPCEPEVCNVLARVLQEGDVAVDGGANVGFLTLMMARLVGPTGRVYAFEPGGNNLPKIAANLKLNKIENVEVIDKPLMANASESVFLYEVDHPGYNSIWRDDSKELITKRVVTPTTLDLEFQRMPKAPALIKLDIEGAEMAALEGARMLLLTKPVVIAEMNEAAFDRAGVSFADLRGFMQERGYDAFMLDEDGNLPAFIPRKTEIAPLRLNVNVMFSTIEQVEKFWPQVLI